MHKTLSSLHLVHEAAQATSCHNFSSRSTYLFTPMSSRMRNFRATSGSALIHSFIYHDAPLHSRGRDNVNIMFPPTRCDVFISGHGADRRRGRVTGAEVTLTAVAAVLGFPRRSARSRSRSALPWLRDESVGNDAARGCAGNLRRFQRAALVTGECGRLNGGRGGGEGRGFRHPA